MTRFWIVCGVLFLLPVVLPRGKWLLWSSVAIGALIAILWAQHMYVTSRPGFSGSVESSVGQGLMVGVTALWTLGLAVRYIIWLFQLKRAENFEKQLNSSND